MRYFYLCLGFCCQISLSAQPEEYVIPFQRNSDFVYQSYLASVTFAPVGAPLDYPIIGLRDGSQMELNFDDMDADYKDFYYTVKPCNADWSDAENLRDMDWLDGFKEDRLVDFALSSNTRTQYTHYSLSIPNTNMDFLKSGNYLLKIYLSGDQSQLVLTRRFCVAENMLGINIEPQPTSDVGKSRTHQEMDISLGMRNFKNVIPERELIVKVIQNGRWDTQYTFDGSPFRRFEEFDYDFQDKCVFPGGKEFRPLDLRTLQGKGPQVYQVQSSPFDWKVWLIPDKPRTYQPYLFLRDIDGRFFIENFDLGDSNIEAEYAKTTFYLNMPKLYDGSVYVFGKISDWLPLEKFKMEYNEELQSYQLTVPLKQGFYDFAYAFVPEGKDQPELSRLEGDNYETANDYTVFVYYRPFGALYDRLVSYKTWHFNRGQ